MMMHQVINAYVLAGAAEDTLADLFAGGEIGDWWRFDPENTDANVDNDPITQATGIVNGLLLTNPGTAPFLDDVAGRWACRTSGVSSTRLIHNFGSTIAQPGTLIICLGDSDTGTHVIATGSSSTLRWQISNDSSGNLIAFAGSVLDSTINEPPAPTAKVFTVEFNGASSKFRVNGTQVATGNTGSQGTNQLTLGALYDGTFPGGINFYSAFIRGGGLLSADNLDRAERLLGSHAGLTW